MPIAYEHGRHAALHALGLRTKAAGVTPAMVLSPLLGGAVGAGTGALVAGEGDRGTGALVGGALGGGLGLANSYGLHLKTKPIWTPPPAAVPEEWEGVVDILNQTKPVVQEAVKEAARMPDIDFEALLNQQKPYSALKTVGHGLMGGVAGLVYADDENKGLGTTLGILGGASLGHLNQLPPIKDIMKQPYDMRRHVAAVGPGVLGGVLGAGTGYAISDDEHAGMGTVMGGLYGAGLGAVGGHMYDDASQLLGDIRAQRATRKAYKDAVKNYKVEPHVPPPMKRLTADATKTSALKTAGPFNLGTEGRALAARYGAGAVGGGLLGYGMSPDITAEHGDKFRAQRDRIIANTIAGSLLGAGVSGGTKHLSNHMIQHEANQIPIVQNLVNEYKSEFF